MWIVDHEAFPVFEHDCAPVFSTILLSIGKDRGIVLRETYYISVSKPCAAELLALREANCAATTGSVQAGSVRCFQARLFYSNRLHRPPQGIPSGWTSRCRRSGLWFLISVFILTYIYTYRYMLGVAQVQCLTHVAHTYAYTCPSHIKHTNYMM